jgi:PmbA protein
MSEEILSIIEPFIVKGQKMGADEIELFAQRRDYKTVNYESNKLKSSEATTLEGVGIRVLIDNALGFASVNSLDKKKITTSIKEAIAIAKVAQPETYYRLPERKAITEIDKLYDKTIETFTIDDVIAKGLQLMKNALDYDSRVSIDSGGFETEISNRAIVNSNDIQFTEKKSSFSYGVFGMAIDGDDVGSFDYEYGGVIYAKEVDIKKVSESYAKKVLAMLGAEKTNSFEGTMILTPEAVTDLVYLLIYAVTATNIQSGSSYLQDKLGEKVADNNFSMIDDGTLTNKIGSYNFDREGIPPQRLAIFDKGAFTGVLYDSFTANKEKLESTGHASGSFRKIPSIQPSNLFIKAGKQPIEEIIREVKDGILVQRMSVMPDPIAGDFSGVIKGGKLIKNGKQIKTLKEVTAVGNIFDCIKNLMAISKETKTFPGNPSFYLPYLAFNEIKFVS